MNEEAVGQVCKTNTILSSFTASSPTDVTYLIPADQTNPNTNFLIFAISSTFKLISLLKFFFCFYL